MKRKIYYYYFLIFSIVFAFNELLGMYVPQMLVRGIYIAVMCICILVKIIDNNFVFRLKKMDLLILIYILFIGIRVIVQYVFNSTSDVTFVALIQMVLPIGAYFLAQELDTLQSERIEGFFAITVAISVVVGFLDSRLNFLPDKGAFSNGLYASVGGSVVLRGYSMAGSALTTGYMCVVALGFLIQSKQINNLFWKIVFIVILIGCGLTLSRGAYAALIIIFAFLFIFKLKEGIFRKRKIYWLVLGILCSFVFVIFNFNKIINSSVFQRIFVVGMKMSDGSNHARVIWQMNAIKAFLEKPLFGYGIGFCGYQAAVNEVHGLINTESYVLSILISLGFVGLLVFCLIIYNSLKSNNINQENYKYCAILYGVLAWSVFYIVLDSDLTAMFYWYCIGKIQYNKITFVRNSILK